MGDEAQVYYDNQTEEDFSGVDDYALILDFDSTQDIIQLSASGDYLFNESPEGFPEGTAIFLRTSGANELIAILQGVTNFEIGEDLENSPIRFI